MPSKIYSVSLPQDLADFIDADPELSLSKIAQVKVREIIESRNIDPLVARLQRKINALQAEIDRRDVAV